MALAALRFVWDAVMKRLYQQVYLTIFVSLFLVVLVAGTVWRFGSVNSPTSQALEIAGELIAACRRAAANATAGP